MQANPLSPWADHAAQWLTARTEKDDVFAERVGPLSRNGIPDIPILNALIHLDLAQRSTSAVKNDARTRTDQALTTFGGERLLATLFEPDTRSDEANVAQSSVLTTLPDREREIATLLLEGLSYAKIGKELFITRSTVSFHLTRIYAKTGTQPHATNSPKPHTRDPRPRPRPTS